MGKMSNTPTEAPAAARDTYSISRGGPRFLAIYAPLVFVTWLVNYPGRAAPDAIDMLWQGQEISRLGSWHSPFVTFLYALPDPIMGSPAGALLMQALVAMIWPASIFWRILSATMSDMARRLALVAWSIVTMALIALAGQVLKDIMLLAILSALLATLTSRLANKRFLAFALVVAACLVRQPNFAVFLFVGGALYLLAPWRVLPPVKSALVGAAGVGIATFAVMPALLPAKPAYPATTLYLFDLAGISASLRENVFEEIGAPPGTLTPDPWDCYTPNRSDIFMWGDCKIYGKVVGENMDKFPAFWLSAIARHPIAYIEHRLRYAVVLFSMNDTTQNLLVPPPPDFNYVVNTPASIDFMPVEKRSVQMWKAQVGYLPFGVVAHNLFRSPLGHPLLWLVLCLAGLAWGVREARRGNVTLILVASLYGVGNALMFIVLSPADDIRYLLPTFLGALTVIVEGLAHWRGSGERRGIAG